MRDGDLHPPSHGDRRDPGHPTPPCPPPPPGLPGGLLRPTADRMLRMAEFAKNALAKAGLDPHTSKDDVHALRRMRPCRREGHMNPPDRPGETGEACLATALRTAADRFYTVPGYPMTTLGESCGGAVCTVNEKVALEYALGGDAVSGRRACVILKNVGLNACMDPLMNAAVQGLSGGLVIVVGDDTEVKGSQNAQDSRCIGRVAEIPVFAPAADELATVVETAFRASEQFSRIALVRVTPPAVLTAETNGHPPARNQRAGTIADASLTMRGGRSEAAENRRREMVRWAQENTIPHSFFRRIRQRALLFNRLTPGRCAGNDAVTRLGPHLLPGGLSVYPPPGGHAGEEPAPDPGHRLWPSLQKPAMGNWHCRIWAGISPAVAATSTGGVALMGDYALMHSG
ncbi:indolepyruvate ferredoxin oxidoreductase [Methanogenium cariaci]|uniref:indolepyruvate ferredoxin oxidoreductase n=1 Tax=Methanogenium cariaci TaxID=2197 RepID=UPI001FDF1E98|nr:indolepyruvate ferredoxin oxidoreductase [Methanogenium cariaci]